jgi:hypothetical protein
MVDAASDGAMRQRPELLVFVHIPKTAGSTFRGVLNANEPGARSRALPNVYKGGGGIDRGVVKRLRKGEGRDLGGVALVRGHVPLGIREYLPNYLPKQRRLACFTFLREPADRMLSHYYAIRDRHEGREEPGRYAEASLPPGATLDDALEAGLVHDNLQTRMLCGDPEPFGEVTEEMLDRAKRNLSEELVFFGLTERFDESLVLAKRRLGLRVILYRQSGRVNPERPRGKEIPAELRRAAERLNRYDSELYRHASELFDSALEPRDLEFEVELAALRAASTDGEPEVATPAPAGFGGDDEAWRMLVAATAKVQQSNWERFHHRIPHIPPTVQAEALEEELKASRARAARLEREVERLSSGRPPSAAEEKVKKLEREVEVLKRARSRAKRLALEVKRLTGERSRTPRTENR